MTMISYEEIASMTPLPNVAALILEKILSEEMDEYEIAEILKTVYDIGFNEGENWSSVNFNRSL